MFLFSEIKKCVKEKRAIIIVGAGVSVATTGNNDASWKGLLKMGIERCIYVGSPRPAPEWEEIMLKLLEIGDTEDWLIIAEQVQRRLSGGELVSWLRDWSDGLQIKNDNVIKAIQKLKLPIMTTNYDMLIENVTGRKAVSLEADDQEKLVNAQENPENYVIHLHGYFDKPDKIVLGIRSYDTFLEDEFKAFFMKLLPAFRSAIFVGCGAGLADPNFSALKGWISKNRHSISIRHYRLLAKEEDNGIQPEARIVPLIYGNKHSDLEDFLSKIIC